MTCPVCSYRYRHATDCPLREVPTGEPWYATAVWWGMIVVCVALPMALELGKSCLRAR